MRSFAYYRCSTSDQSIESQRSVLSQGGVQFKKEFSDVGISGSVLAKDRKGLSDLMAWAQEGDCVYVYAIDRLGRDGIDIQNTVRHFLNEGVNLYVHGLGFISKGAGEIVVAVLAQIAQMEKDKIKERCQAGLMTAKEALRTTGKTHRGKLALGRPVKADAETVRNWREAKGASLSQTAENFGLSLATVKRYLSMGKGEQG